MLGTCTVPPLHKHAQGGKVLIKGSIMTLRIHERTIEGTSLTRNTNIETET